MSSFDPTVSSAVFLKDFLQANGKFQKGYDSERDETLRSIRSLLNMLDETSTAEKCEDVRSAIDKAVIRLAINTSKYALTSLTCVEGVNMSPTNKSSPLESKSTDLSKLVSEVNSVIIKTNMGTFTIPYGPTTTLDNVATIIAAGLGWTASEISFGKDGSPLERRSLGSLGIQPGSIIEAYQGASSSSTITRFVTPVNRRPYIQPTNPTPSNHNNANSHASKITIHDLDQEDPDLLDDPPERRPLGGRHSLGTAGAKGWCNRLSKYLHGRLLGAHRFDIGIWGTHQSSPLNHVLTGSSASSASSSSSSTSSTLSSTLANIPSHLVRDMVTQVKQEKFGSHHHLTHSSHPTVRHQLSSSLVLLSPEQRNTLIKEIDRRAESKDTDVIPGMEEDIHADFKSTLTFEELSQVIGREAVDGLLKAFGGDADMVKLRRVKARSVEEGQYCINFHADYALKTLGIALNDSSEYTGGRIVYAHEDGTLDAPLRTPGTGLLHDNTWVHGVTTLQSGTRYHLFLLKH